ncbi:hypothetical protein [Photorhabdus khanii]|uniref:hypothetical protein n=1 Tax=Photorhabdus khanii TaxID=1004150 RepID=UPI0018653A48|nr:hypothetical protein [Photorhabdus khanii]
MTKAGKPLAITLSGLKPKKSNTGKGKTRKPKYQFNENGEVLTTHPFNIIRFLFLLAFLFFSDRKRLFIGD